MSAYRYLMSQHILSISHSIPLIDPGFINNTNIIISLNVITVVHISKHRLIVHELVCKTIVRLVSQWTYKYLVRQFLYIAVIEVEFLKTNIYNCIM